MAHIIGIDIGTTNIKAAAYDLRGQKIIGVSRKMITHIPRPDFSEYHAEEIWQNVIACLCEIASRIASNSIIAIGVASMAEAGVPVDQAGKPTFPIITWYDSRTNSQAEWWARQYSGEQIFAITGQYLHGKYGINKLLWIRENVPDAYQKTVKWLSVEDYVIYRLSGEFATDYSVAARTMAFDVNKLEWSDELLSKAEVPKELLPAVFPGGTVVGMLSEVVAVQTGLKPKVPVVTGGHDHACAAMAVKIFESGTILDSMGTAEATMIAVKEPQLNAEAYRMRLCMYPHCGNLLYRVLTSIQAAGGSIEWFLTKLGFEYQYRAAEENRNVYDLVMEVAAMSPPGASGLYYVPHIRGLIGYPHARGAFVGLKDSHTSADFARAIIEGLSYELRDRIENCQKIFGHSFTKLKVVGGASKSYFWMQTKANLLGREVEVPDNDEAAGFGAALLAAIGAGVFNNEVEAATQFYKAKNIYNPQTDQSEFWDKRYHTYTNVVAALLNVYQKAIE